MIIINKPKIDKTNSRLICEIQIDEETKQIYFEVEKEYVKYLTYERSDAFLIGILPLAMRKKHDIKCLTPVTEELLYKINTYLIPSLVKNSKNLYNPKILAETKEALKNSSAVGTGCSCGVDSMHAIYNYINPKYKSLKLTHLCINNVGSFNECYKDYGVQKVREERIVAAKKLAKELKLPLIITNSNIFQETKEYFSYSHTYYSSFAIHALQKLFKTYFYGSSGYDFSTFNIKNSEEIDSSNYELLSLENFSTNNLKIYSEGGEKTRIEKFETIKDYKIAQKHLHVCTSKSTNCGKCSKCKRTLLILYALNKLDEFKEVFDIEYFKQNKFQYLEWLYNEHLNNNIMNEPTFQKLKNDEYIQKLIKQNKNFSKIKMKLKTKTNTIKELYKTKGLKGTLKEIKQYIKKR